jgi:hypothetical protein
MKLANQLDHSIMFALNKDKYSELKPNDYVLVPDTCRTLHLKPNDFSYKLSTDYLFNMPVDKIIISDNIKSGFGENTLTITEQEQPGIAQFLNFLYRDGAAMGGRIYAPKFDLTDYSLDPVTVTKIDRKKVTDDIVKMSTDAKDYTSWMVVLIIIIFVCIFPVFVFAIIGSRDSIHD